MPWPHSWAWMTNLTSPRGPWVGWGRRKDTPESREGELWRRHRCPQVTSPPGAALLAQLLPLPILLGAQRLMVRQRPLSTEAELTFEDSSWTLQGKLRCRWSQVDSPHNSAPTRTPAGTCTESHPRAQRPICQQTVAENIRQQTLTHRSSAISPERPGLVLEYQSF